MSAEVVTPAVYDKRREDIAKLNTALGRALWWNHIESYNLVFELGSPFECVVEGKAFPQALHSSVDVYLYLKNRIERRNE